MANIWKRIYYFAIILIYLFLLAPVIVVIATSFNPGELSLFPPQGFSLKWYSEFFNNSRFVKSFFITSFPIAIIASFVSTILGLMIAYIITRYRLIAHTTIETFFFLPLMVPNMVVGISLLFFFIRIGVNNTFIALILSHVVITIPYAIRNLSAGLYRLNPAIEEAAISLGATKPVAILKITIPQIKSAIIATIMFTFIISFADVNVALFLVRGESITIPVSVFLYLIWRSGPIIAAISTIQVVVIFALGMLIERAIGIGTAFKT